MPNRVIFRFLLVVVVLFSFVVYLLWQNNGSSQLGRMTTPISAEDLRQAVGVPSPTPVMQIDTASQTTPDGKKKLLMKKTHNPDGSKTIVFTVEDEEKQQIPIFATSVKAGDDLRIPFNTWSPDNKYLFIEKVNGDALLFRADGEEMSEGELFWDIASIFNSSGKTDIYKETTGWAANTLLIINTTTEKGDSSNAYWFEVPSQAILQLSSPY